MSVIVASVASFVVASKYCSQHDKDRADFVCDGTDDHVEIQQAIDAAAASDAYRGGIVWLMPGPYWQSAPIMLRDNVHLMSADEIFSAKVILASGSNCNQFEWGMDNQLKDTGIVLGNATIVGGQCIQGIFAEGNKIYNTRGTGWVIPYWGISVYRDNTGSPNTAMVKVADNKLYLADNAGGSFTIKFTINLLSTYGSLNDLAAAGTQWKNAGWIISNITGGATGDSLIQAGDVYKCLSIASRALADTIGGVTAPSPVETPYWHPCLGAVNIKKLGLRNPYDVNLNRVMALHQRDHGFWLGIGHSITFNGCIAEYAALGDGFHLDYSLCGAIDAIGSGADVDSVRMFGCYSLDQKGDGSGGRHGFFIEAHGIRMEGCFATNNDTGYVIRAPFASIIGCLSSRNTIDGFRFEANASSNCSGAVMSGCTSYNDKGIGINIGPDAGGVVVSGNTVTYTVTPPDISDALYGIKVQAPFSTVVGNRIKNSSPKENYNYYRDLYISAGAYDCAASGNLLLTDGKQFDFEGSTSTTGAMCKLSGNVGYQPDEWLYNYGSTEQKNIETTMNGATFRTKGAIGPQTFKLPAATPDLTYTVVISVGHQVTIDPQNSDTININGSEQGAGKYIRCSSSAAWVALRCEVAGKWIARWEGTWTVEA